MFIVCSISKNLFHNLIIWLHKFVLKNLFELMILSNPFVFLLALFVMCWNLLASVAHHTITDKVIWIWQHFYFRFVERYIIGDITDHWPWTIHLSNILVLLNPNRAFSPRSNKDIYTKQSGQHLLLSLNLILYGSTEHQPVYLHSCDFYGRLLCNKNPCIKAAQKMTTGIYKYEAFNLFVSQVKMYVWRLCWFIINRSQIHWLYA